MWIITARKDLSKNTKTSEIRNEKVHNARRKSEKQRTR
jgi:hypothetical protein